MDKFNHSKCTQSSTVYRHAESTASIVQFISKTLDSRLVSHVRRMSLFLFVFFFLFVSFNIRLLLIPINFATFIHHRVSTRTASSLHTRTYVECAYGELESIALYYAHVRSHRHHRHDAYSRYCEFWWFRRVRGSAGWAPLPTGSG